jgi:hypothetical protein
MLVGVANAAKFTSINSGLPDDVLVICTGSSVKYISEKALFADGLMVEIEVEFGDKESAQQENVFTCPIDEGLEKSKLLNINAVSQHLTRIGFLLGFSKIGQQPHSSFAFVLLPSRAPPFLV